jgi:hypothetical protein
LQRQNRWIIVGVIVASVLVFLINPFQLIFNFFNINVEAAGHLARAETAQTPEEVIEHVRIAQNMLPISGAIAWWSLGKGDYESLQAQLDGIVIRARNISPLPSGEDQFNSEMLSIHAELENIQERLITF